MARLDERLSAAHQLRREDQRLARAARRPWTRLPAEDDAPTRRAQMIGLVLGLALTAVLVVIVVWWFVSLFTYSDPPR